MPNVIGLYKSFDVSTQPATALNSEFSYVTVEPPAVPVISPPIEIGMRSTAVEKGFKMILEPGVMLILGKTATGKSYIVKHLAAYADIPVFGFREPGIGPLMKESQLFDAIANAMHVGQKIIIVDSLRTFFYDTQGRASSSGGVTMSLFTIMSAWDQWAAYNGVSVIFTLNPQTTNDELIANWRQAAEGACSYVVTTSAPGMATFVSRWGDRRPHDVVIPNYDESAVRSDREIVDVGANTPTVSPRRNLAAHPLNKLRIS